MTADDRARVEAAVADAERRSAARAEEASPDDEPKPRVTAADLAEIRATLPNRDGSRSGYTDDIAANVVVGVGDPASGLLVTGRDAFERASFPRQVLG